MMYAGMIYVCMMYVDIIYVYIQIYYRASKEGSQTVFSVSDQKVPVHSGYGTVPGSLTVEYRKKPYEAYKKALFLSILLNLLVLVCARYDIIKRKEVFYVYKYHW